MEETGSSLLRTSVSSALLFVVVTVLVRAANRHDVPVLTSAALGASAVIRLGSETLYVKVSTGSYSTSSDLVAGERLECK